MSTAVPHAPQQSLTVRHALIALAVVAVWGTNFVVIKVALLQLPPLLLAALRFTFAAVPAVFFFKRPTVSWLNLAAYGVLIGAGQFGLLYMAMGHDISPGLASLVVQTQVFFTIAIAAMIDKERVRGFQIVALVLAIGGIGLIMLHSGGAATPVGVALTLVAAMSWAGGNLLAKAAGPMNMLAYVVWASLFSFPPLYLASFLLEGWPAMSGGLHHANLATWAAVIWQSVGNTLFGYTLWAWLLARYPAAVVSPIALLVPVFGMAASAVLLAEPLPVWKLEAAGLVLLGLAVNTLWPRLRSGRVADPA